MSVRIYAGPLSDKLRRLAERGRRPLSWQVQIALEKGIEVLEGEQTETESGRDT